MAYTDSTVATAHASSCSVAVPNNTAAQTIVILAADVDDVAAVLVWPAGFLQMYQGTLSVDGQVVGIAWKRLAAAESGNYTVSGPAGPPDWVLSAAAFSGRSTSAPPVINVTNHNTGDASPVSVAAPGVTALAGDDLVWISLPDVNATGIGNGHTPPSTYTEAEDSELAFSNLSIAYKENVSAGATGTITGTLALTSGTAGWVGALIRIPKEPVATVEVLRPVKLTRYPKPRLRTTR